MMVDNFIYQNTLGPLTYFYLAEIIKDAPLSIAVLAINIFMLYFALSTSSLLSSSLGPEGLFVMLGVLTLLTGFYCYFFIKETAGLLDNEKKQLYIPNKYKDAKARNE